MLTFRLGGPAVNEVDTVVIVSDFGQVEGGASSAALSTANLLAAAGINVRLLVGKGYPESLNESIAVTSLEQEDLINHPQQAKAAVRGLWNPGTRRALQEALADVERDGALVHTHSWTKILSPSLFQAVGDTGLPHLVTLHDYFSICPNGNYYRFDVETICDRVPMSGKCVLTNCDARSYSHKLWRVARHSFQTAAGFPVDLAGVIAVSDFSLELIGGFLDDRVPRYVLPNPISVGESASCLPSSGGYFLYAGRLSREKGWRIAVEASRMAGADLVIAGDGPQASQVAGTPGVRHVGWLDTDTLREYMRGARALVVPSLVPETQGLAVLEAAERGLPAIVPSGTAMAAQIGEGGGGVVFRNGDAQSLAAAMNLLLSNGGLSDQLGRQAREQVLCNALTPNRYVDKLLDIYNHAFKASIRR